MSSSSSSAVDASSHSSSRRGVSAKTSKDPVLRNALRYTVSQREYELLHQYLLSRSPALRKRTPEPKDHGEDEGSRPVDDYNAATIRLSMRLFLACYSGLKLWDAVSKRLLKRGNAAIQAKTTRVSLWKSADFRLSLSVSSILLFHRLLYRFFSRLRESLRTDEARPFRRRNPRIARALTSKLAAPIGASVAGLFLGVSPADQTRITITIYVISRALEFGFNAIENKGYLKSKPWWFGSWVLMPFAYGQLLDAFVLDRDCFPEGYGGFILKRSPQYIQHSPAGYEGKRQWPGTFDIVDCLAEISRLRWPGFSSPIIFPNKQTLPASLAAIAPISDPAHPGIKNLSCAVLHPHDPSCLKTYFKYWAQAFPAVARFFTIVYGVFALPRYKALLRSPLPFLNKFAARVLRTSLSITGAIGTAWASICLLQQVLPRGALATKRWFVAGFISGLWAYIERDSGPGAFLYSARTSADSLWKIGKKRGWWKGIKNGDVVLFAMALMMINVTYERDPAAVASGPIRKGWGVLRGEGWVDRAEPVSPASASSLLAGGDKAAQKQQQQSGIKQQEDEKKKE